jgi:hypothetical protein
MHAKTSNSEHEEILMHTKMPNRGYDDFIIHRDKKEK